MLEINFIDISFTKNIQVDKKRTGLFLSLRSNVLVYDICIKYFYDKNVGGAGADPPMYKMRTFFLLPQALCEPIFNKKSHLTRAVEIFKIWPKFESFHSSCTMKYFVENWHIESQGQKKNRPHSWKLGQFYFIKETIGK